MKNKFSIAMSLAVILAMLLTSVGLADNINNDIAAHVGSDNISVGGFTTVGYKVVASGGDNQTGCNAIDGSPLNLTINVPTNVSASGATLLAGNKLKFTTCGDFQYVTYTSNVAADYPITTSYSDTGTGTYNDNADFTLHVTGSSDTTAPVLSLPSNITTESTGSSGAVVNFTATANDAVDGSVAVTCVPASGSTFAIGTATVTCSATDAAGNTGTGSFTVKVQDTTAPVLSLPSNITTEATGPSGAVAIFSASALDIVDGSVAVTCIPASGSTFAIGTATVTCSATDAAGNTGTGSFTVKVQDTTAPVVTVPANMTLEATGPSGAVAIFSASALDIVDGSVAVTCIPASGSTFAIGTATVTCSATDAAGNTGTGSFTVKVQDTTAPVVTVPANMTLEATGPSGAVAIFSASALDIVDGSVAVTCIPASGSTFAIGTATVTCSATDAAGNTGTGSFTVKVQDTTAPVVTVPANMTLEATGPSGAVAIFSASALDIVDGSVAVTCIPASGSTFAIGTATVTCSATDAAGNTGTGSFTVKVQDTTAPVVTVPANMTLEATGPSGAVAIFSASALDIVDGSVAVTCIPASGSTFAIGTATVTCSATDAAGNTGTGSFTVKVQDTTAPVVTVPANMTLEATGPSGAVAIFSASALDIVDGSVAVTCIPASGSTFAIGTATVTCSATDAAGNTGTGSFTVKVQDTTAPVVTVPANMTLEATGPSGAVAIFSASALDIVDGSVAVTCIPASGSTFAIGTATVTCSATDAAGNTGTGSFTVKVQDTTAPVVTVPANMTLEATGPSGAVAIFSASALDIVDGSVAVTCIPASGSTFAIGTATVTCSATDAAGNTGTGSFTVKVQDTTAPVVTVPANMTLEATGPSGAVAIFSASALDIVDGSVAVTCIPASGSTFAIGTATVTCSATDAAGNTGTGSFTVKVQDTTAPVVTVPANMTLEATGPSGAVAIFSASALDIVDGSVAVTCIPASGSTFAIGTATVTCSATDAAGNTGTGSFTVKVQDTTAPVVTVPANMTLEATGPSGAVAIFSASALDIVDGSVAVTCIPASGSTFAIGTATVTCSATDAAGNTGTGSFTVKVQDTTAPVVTVPANMTLEATGPSGAVAIFSASALDIVDGSVAVTCIPASGSTFAIGTATVTCSATDAAGNTGTGSFTVKVQDTTAPVVTVPANISTSATSISGAVVTYTATANDIVDGSVLVTCNPASGSTFAPGSTTVNCSATDAAGNTGTGSFTISVTFNFSGFLAPVNNPNTVNTRKAGRTYPVKWQLPK